MVAGLLLIGGAAWSSPPPPRARTLIAQAATTRSEAEPEANPDDEIARRYFVSGSAQYARRDYRAALASFEAMSELKPVGAAYYNIARCHDRLEQYAEASVAYRRYLELSPNSSDEEEIRDRIATLERRLGRRAGTLNVEPRVIEKRAEESPVANAVSPVAKAPQSTAHDSWRRFYYVPLIIGGAVLAGGFGLYGWAASDYHDLAGRCLGNCPGSAVDSVERRAYAGYSLIAVGAVAAAAGVGLGLWHWRKDGVEKTVLVTPVPGGLTMAGSF